MVRAPGTNPICLVDLASLVGLVYLVCPVHLIRSVHLVGLVQPNKQDRLGDFFSILLERGDASGRSHSLKKLDKPIGAGYRDFTDPLRFPSNAGRSGGFPEEESRMKNAAA